MTWAVTSVSLRCPVSNVVLGRPSRGPSGASNSLRVAHFCCCFPPCLRSKRKLLDTPQGRCFHPSVFLWRTRNALTLLCSESLNSEVSFASSEGCVSFPTFPSLCFQCKQCHHPLPAHFRFTPLLSAKTLSHQHL